jgi:hypothetical protein
MIPPVIAVLVGYTISIAVGAVFVNCILKRLRLTPEERTEIQGGIPNAGLIIGLLERAIVTTLVYLGEWNAIAFIFTAKGIVRFESVRHRYFAEYFLIGTLSSILFAAAVALIVKYVVGAPL